MKFNSHNSNTNNFFLINSLSQHSFFLPKPNFIQMFQTYQNLYYYVNVYTWNNTLETFANTVRFWITSNFTFTSFFPNSLLKESNRFFKPALGAARFFKKLPASNRKFFIPGTIKGARKNTPLFLHAKFFSQTQSFYKNQYNLSTPLTKTEDIYFSILPKQKFVLTTPLNGVGLFFKKNSTSLINSEQLLRRNYFLQTLLKLNKNVRVFTNTQTPSINYNSFLNVEPTSLHVTKQHPIVSRQLSFLNNYNLNDLNQGSFTATKSQFLLDFYETFTEIYGNTSNKKFNPLHIHRTVDFRLKFLTFGGLAAGFFLRQFSQLPISTDFNSYNFWSNITLPNNRSYMQSISTEANFMTLKPNKGNFKTISKTPIPFGSVFNPRETMIRNRIVIHKGTIFQMFQNTKLLVTSLNRNASLKRGVTKVNFFKKKLPISPRLKTLRTLFSTTLLRKKRRNWLSKSNRFFKKLKRKKNILMKFPKLNRMNRLSSLTLLTDAPITDLSFIKTRQIRMFWFNFLKTRLLLNLQRRSSLKQKTSLTSHLLLSSNTANLKTIFIQSYLNHLFTTTTKTNIPLATEIFYNFFQKQFTCFLKKTTYSYNKTPFTWNFKQSKHFKFKTHTPKLPFDALLKTLSNFYNKKFLNRINRRLIPFFYLKYQISLNNLNSTDLKPIYLNAVRNITLVTKRNHRINLTFTAHRILNTLIRLQQLQWLNWTTRFFNNLETFWKTYLHQLLKQTSSVTTSDMSDDRPNTFNLFMSRKFKRTVFKKMKKVKKILTKNIKRRFKLIYLFISLVGLRTALYFCKNQTLKKTMHKFLNTLISSKQTTYHFSQEWILGRYVWRAKKLMFQLRKFKLRPSFKTHTTGLNTGKPVLNGNTPMSITNRVVISQKTLLYFVIDKKKPKIVHINQKNYWRKLKNGNFEHYLNNHLKLRLNSLNTFQNIKESTNPFHLFKLKTSNQYQPSTTPFFNRFSLQSRYDLPFIFSNIGFLFITTPQTLWSREYHYDLGMTRARINSHRYSFFYKNDLKRIYIRKPGLLKLISSFQNNLTLPDSENPFQYRFLKTALNQTNPTPHFNTLNVANQFFYNSIDHYRPLNFYQGIWNDTESSGAEFIIKRIRFKPGYQRIWRNARNALNYTLGFHCRYQVGLTKRLVRLKKIRRKDSMKLQELRLSNVLMSSQFTFDVHSTKQLILSGVVFVNGNNVRNENLNTFVGDFIQLVVNLRYYIVYRWLMNWNNYHTLKFTKLLNFKNNSSRSDLSKQTSQTLPNWIFNVGSRRFDIPKYLEVDFLTLSTFILYEPLHIIDYNPLTYLDSRVEIYTLYNWKFIT